MRRAVTVTTITAGLLAVLALAIHGYLATLVHDALDADLAAAMPGTHLVHDGIEVGPFAVSATMNAPRIHRDGRRRPVIRASALTLNRQSSLWAWLARGRLAISVSLKSIDGRTPEGVPFGARSLDLSRMTLEGVAGRLVPVRGVARLRRAHSALDGWPARLAGPLRRAGYSEVRFDARAEYRFERAGQRLIVPRATLGLDNMGELAAGLTLTDLSPAAIAEQPAAALLSAAVAGARITYRDEGLVPGLLAGEAQALGLPRSRYRRRVAGAAAVWLDDRLGHAAAPIASAVDAFLRSPDRLDARLRPTAPVPARTVALAAAFGRWGALAGQLGVTVEAGKASRAGNGDNDASPPAADATARR